MNEWVIYFLFGIVVFLTHTQASITGFGGTVLALPFATMLLGLHTSVPALTFLGWVIAVYIVVRSRKDIQWRALLFILLHVGIGLPAGMFLFYWLPESMLKVVLSVFMMVVGLKGFAKTVIKKETVAAVSGGHSIWMRLVLIIGGVIHGAFGSGGPFVVIYSSKALPDKSLFRVTLCMLWTILGSILLVNWTMAGSVWTLPTFKAIGVGLPFLVSGLLLGDWLHHRVNERLFRAIVYAVLFVSGVIMLLGVIKQGVSI